MLSKEFEVSEDGESRSGLKILVLEGKGLCLKNSLFHFISHKVNGSTTPATNPQTKVAGESQNWWHIPVGDFY